MSGPVLASTLVLVLVLKPLLTAAQGNPSSEDGGSDPVTPSPPTTTGVDSAAGASGSSPGSYNLSLGGEIAIIVVVAVVAMIGIASGVLYYLAKKRGWEVRKTIRRASRRIASRVDLRPASRQSQRPKGMVKMQEAPRTRDRGAVDVEKGEARAKTKKMAPAPPVVTQKTNKEERRFKTVAPDSWTGGVAR